MNKSNTPDPVTPTVWLWQEIERRFGKEATEELRHDYTKQQSLYRRYQSIATYRQQLPGLRARLEWDREAGKPTKILEKRIANAETRIREAGAAIPNGDEDTDHANQYSQERDRASLYTGSRRKLSMSEIVLASRLYYDTSNSTDDICAMLGISRSTLHRYLKIAAKEGKE